MTASVSYPDVCENLITVHMTICISFCSKNLLLIVFECFLQINKSNNTTHSKKLLLVQIVNHHLLKDLTELGLWNDEMKNKLIAHGGSIQVLLIHLQYIIIHLVKFDLLPEYSYISAIALKRN